MLINVRSTKNKIIQVRRMLDRNEPAILIVTEHWLRDSEVEMNQMAGYRVIDAYCIGKKEELWL